MKRSTESLYLRFCSLHQKHEGLAPVRETSASSITNNFCATAPRRAPWM
jgi:hypothetical protein